MGNGADSSSRSQTDKPSSAANAGAEDNPLRQQYIKEMPGPAASHREGPSLLNNNSRQEQRSPQAGLNESLKTNLYSRNDNPHEGIKGTREGGDNKTGDKSEPAIKDIKSSTRDNLSDKDLRGLVDKAFPNADERNEVLNNLDQLRQRAAKDDIAQQDLERFNHQLGRLCQASMQGNERFKPEEIKQIAKDVSMHAAKPGTVKQSNYDTCLFGAVESAAYKSEPAIMAAVVADVVTTGKTTTKDGSIITPPDKSLHGDAYYKGDKESARTEANRIAQVTLANVHWNRQGKDKGKFVYEEGHTPEYRGDNRARIMDYSETPPKPVTRKVGIFNPTDLLTKTGEKNDPANLPMKIGERPIAAPNVNAEVIPEVYKQIGGQKSLDVVSNNGEKAPILSPQSLNEFKQLLSDAKDGKNGLRLPLIAAIDVSKGIIGQDMLTAQKQGEQQFDIAAHAVAIFDYDAKTGLVTVENQKADKLDHTGEPGQQAPIPVADLYEDYKRLGEPIENKVSHDTPENYIEGQRQFVNDLASNPNASPAKTFEERLELLQYLNHWDHKEEAKEQLNKLVSDYPAMLKQQTDSNIEQTINLSTTLAQHLHNENRDSEAQAVLTNLDTKYKSALASELKNYEGNPNELNVVKNYQQIFSAHNNLDNKIPNIHEDLMSSSSISSEVKLALTRKAIASVENSPEKVKSILSSTDAGLKASSFKDNNFYVVSKDFGEYKYLIELHQKTGDKTVPESLVAGMMDGIANLKPDLSNPTHLLSFIEAAGTANKLGYSNIVNKHLDKLVSEQKAFEIPDAFQTKDTILDLAIAAKNDKVTSQLLSEINKTHSNLTEKDPSDWRNEITDYLASTYGKLGQFDNMKRVINHNLALEEKLPLSDSKGIRGPEHQELIPALTNAARLYSESGQNKEAAQILERTLSIAQKSNQTSQQVPSASVNKIREDLAKIYRDLVQPGKAKKD